MQIMLHETSYEHTPLRRNRLFPIEQREDEKNYRQRYKVRKETTSGVLKINPLIHGEVNESLDRGELK